MLYIRPPSLSHLKTFGCLCYATVVSPKKNLICVLDNASSLVTHSIKKDTNFFDIDADTFFTSRDVTFHESVFPFCQQSQTQSSPPSLDILPAIDIDLPTLVQHSLDPPSSSTHHNAHDSLADQPSSPTPRSLTPIAEPSPVDLPVRRSSRTSAPPSWLQDYVKGFQANHLTTTQDWLNGTRYPMHNFLSNSQFSSTHSAYHTNITTTKEPHTYAMDEELSALQLNQTWTLTLYPPDENPSDVNGSIK